MAAKRESLSILVDRVMDNCCRELLREAHRGRDKVGGWKTRTFFKFLIANGNLERLPLRDALDSLCTALRGNLNITFRRSESRGRLRGFWPIPTRRGIERIAHGQWKEVLLERSLALVNGWNCQFSLLAGYGPADSANSRSSNGRKSIDLVVGEARAQRGILIELKEWEGNDSPLAAMIEIIVNFVCFLVVRAKDQQNGGEQGARWPSWRTFRLIVMAPDTYFLRWTGADRVARVINDAIAAKSSQMEHECGIGSCKIELMRLHIDEQQFRSFVAKEKNSVALMDENATPEMLEGAELLKVTV